jgi:hypothetical protein
MLKNCRECKAEFTVPDNRHGRKTIVCSRKCYNRYYQQKLRCQFRQWISKIKDVPCQDCNNKFLPECMDFDHRPGEVKKFNVGSSKMKSLRQRLDEIAKCDIVCSNCHRIRTRIRLELAF